MAKIFNLSVIFKVLDKASKPIRKIGNSLKGLTKPIKKVIRSFKALAKSLKKVGKQMRDIGKSLSMKLTLPLTLLGGLAARSAIQFESAFTGVRKTVEATEPQFQKLKKELEDLSLKIPLATTEIFGIAEAAGQLGIKQEDMLRFTKVMADLGATTNMSAEEAATSLARFANVVGVSSNDFDKLGSVIVDLGNNMAANEQEIVMMGGRLAKAGVFAGLSAHQIMGLSAALTSVGINAEAGGTAFSQVMMRIGKEIGTGSKKMQGFAAVSGKSIGEFEKLWKEDAAEALLLFTEGLKKAEKRGLNVNIILDQLGLDGIRVASSLLAASAAGDKFRGALERSSKAWIENLALTKEAKLRYATAESQLRMAKNRAILLAVSFGNILVPAILKVIKFLEPVVDWLGKLSPTTKMIILVIAALVAVIGPLLIAIGFIASGIAAVMAVGVPVAAIIGAITAAFLGLGAAIVQIIRYWDELKIAFGSMGWKDWFGLIYDIGKAMVKFVLNPFRAVFDIFKKIKGWISGESEIDIQTSEKQAIHGEGPKLPTDIDNAESQTEIQTKPPIARMNENKSQTEIQTKPPIARMNENKSQTDINIKLIADQGTSATVEKVKSKGNIKPNVATVGYIGATF